MWAIIHQELDEMISNHPALKDIGVGSTRHPCIAGCFFVSIQASLAGWNVLFEVLNTSHPDGSAVRVPPPPRLLFSPIIQASFSGERTRRGLELIGSGGLEGFWSCRKVIRRHIGGHRKVRHIGTSVDNLIHYIYSHL